MPAAYGLHIKTHFYVHCKWSLRKNSFLCPLHMVSTYKPICLSTAYGFHEKTYFYVHCLWSPRINPFYVHSIWSPRKNPFLCRLLRVSTYKWIFTWRPYAVDIEWLYTWRP